MIRTTLRTTAALLLVLSACAVPTEGSAPYAGEDLRTWSYVPDLPVTDPPYRQVHASWKQRLDVPYVYMDHHGSYTGNGALIPTLHRELLAQGLEPGGPPFAMFYDDPGTVRAGELLSRACIPIRGARAVRASLNYAVLRSTTVGDAFVSGPCPDAPRAYPGVLEYLGGMGWRQDGPIRELYLVPPGLEPDPKPGPEAWTRSLDPKPGSGHEAAGLWRVAAVQGQLARCRDVAAQPVSRP